MRKLPMRSMVSCLAMIFSLIILSGPAWAAPGQEKVEAVDQQDAQGPAGDSARERLSRIDFGNTYIIGQTIKSGAVYLLQRKKSEIKSMLKYREDYRTEILEGFAVGDMDDSGRRQEEKPEQVKPVSLTGKPDSAETGQDK